MEIKTIEQLLENGYKFSHTALHVGYISRKRPEGIISKYNGRYGKGYVIDYPNWKSTNFCFRDYYLKY